MQGLALLTYGLIIVGVIYAVLMFLLPIYVREIRGLMQENNELLRYLINKEIPKKIDSDHR